MYGCVVCCSAVMSLFAACMVMSSAYAVMLMPGGGCGMSAV